MTPEQALVELDIAIRNLQEILVAYYGERGVEAFDELLRQVVNRAMIFDIPLDEDEALEILSEVL